LSTTQPRVTALRGPALTFVDDPFLVGPEHSYRYESDALIVMRDGIIASFGPYGATRDEVPPGTAIVEYGADSLAVPGFVDAHVHYPQTQMIGAPGGQLLDWLNAYALPAEQQFADRTHAQAVARVFLRELLRAGTTTAAVFCTVFPESVDAFFEESERLNTRATHIQCCPREPQASATDHRRNLANRVKSATASGLLHPAYGSIGMKSGSNPRNSTILVR
jgi:guanine deaminase